MGTAKGTVGDADDSIAQGNGIAAGAAAAGVEAHRASFGIDTASASFGATDSTKEGVEEYADDAMERRRQQCCRRCLTAV